MSKEGNTKFKLLASLTGHMYPHVLRFSSLKGCSSHLGGVTDLSLMSENNCTTISSNSSKLSTTQYSLLLLVNEFQMQYSFKHKNMFSLPLPKTAKAIILAEYQVS